MKTAFVATALLSSAAAASAQSSVTLFGVVDAAISRYTARSEFYNDSGRIVPLPANGNAVTRTQTVLSNSANSNSRLGFRGTEDLGGGLAASFWLESPLANDSGAGGLTSLASLDNQSFRRLR